MSLQSNTVGREAGAGSDTLAEQRLYRARNNHASFTIHLENAYASGRQKRPRGPRSKYSHRYYSVPKSRPAYGPDTFRQEAHVFFVVYHLDGLNDIAPINEKEQSLQEYMMGKHDPILDKAVSSLSLAVFARSKLCRAAAIEATTEYQVLLQLMQTAISSLKPTDLETCLLAVLFMSLYEDAMYVEHQLGPLEFHRSQGGRHTAGIIAMLRRWKEENTTTKAPLAVKHARRLCVKSALTRNWPIPDWLWDGEIFGEQGLSLEYDRVTVRAFSARQELSRRRQNQTFEGVQRLLEDLQRLDIQLQAWTLHFPTEWRCTKLTLSDCGETPNSRLFSPLVYTYSQPAEACPWIRYYSMRLLICSLCVDILRLDAPGCSVVDTTAHEQELLATIRRAAIDLASALPMVMGRLTKSSKGYTWNAAYSTSARTTWSASGLIVPIVIASGHQYIDLALRDWFKLQIIDLGKTLGYGLLASVTRAGWLVV